LRTSKCVYVCPPPERFARFIWPKYWLLIDSFRARWFAEFNQHRRCSIFYTLSMGPSYLWAACHWLAMVRYAVLIKYSVCDAAGACDFRQPYCTLHHPLFGSLCKLVYCNLVESAYRPSSHLALHDIFYVCERLCAMVVSLCFLWVQRQARLYLAAVWF
jgi:hypothetical protein